MNKNTKIKIEKLQEIFFKVWSKESSSKYTEQNPANGQCGVTALVVQDVLGGSIMKTLLDDGWHFYNKIDDEYYDSTESQFSQKLKYMHVISTREEAFEDTNSAQYSYLKNNVLNYWHNMD